MNTIICDLTDYEISDKHAFEGVVVRVDEHPKGIALIVADDVENIFIRVLGNAKAEMGSRVVISGNNTDRPLVFVNTRAGFIEPSSNRNYRDYAMEKSIQASFGR